MNYLIVGGVAGGATVAARLRRMDEHANIVLFERGKYVSYANCGLPYYIGGTIADRNKLFVQSVEGFTRRFRIDIRTEQEVVRIDREKRLVEVRRLATGELYTEPYDKLVLSVGAEPLRPPIEGIDDRRIFTLRSVPDTDAIKEYLLRERPRRAVVVGGGFIGLEMAENLHEAGLHVDVVEMAPQVMAPLDFSMAAIVHRHLQDKGVGLRLSEGVGRFEDAGAAVAVHLQSGARIEADMVLLSIGVRSENRLAREAGLRLGARGGIVVDDRMRSSDPDIYALGDVVEVLNPVTGRPTMIPLAGPANKQGRIVADNIVFGDKSTYSGSIGTSIAKVFDLTVATAGMNARQLQREGIPYRSSYTHSSSHAGYYPGAVPMSIKVVFAPDSGRLLGVQIVGYGGVDKRIEMAAQVIQRGGTVYDLTELEHAYAPPYSSAKDPINMAGYVAENILTGKCRTLHWREVAGLPEETVRIDVRTRAEYELGSIPGFVNIPLDELREHLDELPRNRPLVVTCAVGLRGYLASRILTQHGFDDVRNLSGGYRTWLAATAPLTPPNGGGEQGTSARRAAEAAPVSEDGSVGSEAPATSAACGCGEVVEVDACGLMCPGPVMQLKRCYEGLSVGGRLRIRATDQAFARDVVSWCRMTGARLEGVEQHGGIVEATVSKGEAAAAPACCGSSSPSGAADGKTLIVFSDDLDRALASFVIANGAAAAGKHVTMFFTFWGLNIIKKQQKPSVAKDLFGRMFGWMMPSDSRRLSLSKMNFFGLGSRMMRHVMRTKRIDSLEQMMRQAADNGVEMIACTMSMDVMGIRREELLDNVTLGGVAAYLEQAEQANVNLFI